MLSPRILWVLVAVFGCQPVEPAPLRVAVADVVPGEVVKPEPATPVEDASQPSPAWGGEPGLRGEEALFGEKIGSTADRSGFLAAQTLRLRLEACGEARGDRRFEIVIEEAGNTWLTWEMAVDATLVACITRAMDRSKAPKSWAMHARTTPDARGRGGREWKQGEVENDF